MANGKPKDSIGQPFYTYVQEKVWESRSGRPISKEQNSRPTSWGTLVEQRVFDILPIDYIYQSSTRYVHDELPWSGAPDMLTETNVVDIKCPYSILEFFKKADIILSGDIEKLKKDYPDNFYQLVSNSILTGKKVAELVIYCPYKSELNEIREMAANYNGDQNKVRFLDYTTDDELPYVIDGRYYKNLYQISWEVSEQDKMELYERVKLATEKLNESK